MPKTKLFSSFLLSQPPLLKKKKKKRLLSLKFSVSGNGKSIFHILSPKIHGINFRSSLSHTPYLSDHRQILSSLPSTFQSQPSWLQLLLMPLVLSHRYRSPGLLHYPRRGLWKTSSFVLPQPSLFSVLKSE